MQFFYIALYEGDSWADAERRNKQEGNNSLLDRNQITSAGKVS